MQPLIITCAITGAETTLQQQPALPVTPEQQAEAAYACWQAGAAIIHLHVRDEQARPTQSVTRFAEAIRLIRERCPIIVQISTGGAVGESIQRRAEPLELKPEMASLNAGSINFGDEVFTNLPKDIELLASRMKLLGIKPEVEVYDLGMLEFTHKLINAGKLAEPAHIQFVLGTPYGLSGEARNLCLLADRLPAGASWTAAGIGRWQLPVAAQAILMGGHVRVGFEDNVFWSKGVLAKDNAQLVARAQGLAETLQRPVATAAEARKILGLPDPATPM